MRTETLTVTGFEGRKLPGMLWMPEGELRAVLQVAHGMTEHMGRYEAFAEKLCSHGIAVAGFDLRGHGRNAGDSRIASCGEGGWKASLEDMRLFFQELNHRFPGIPHFMLGFSLGSFLLREYLGKYPEGVDGAVIIGTGHQPGWLLSVIMAIVKGEIKKAGFDGTTELVKKLSFGTYNQKFKPNRTEADWLCSDNAQLSQYLADPMVRKDISAGLFHDLLGSMKRTGGSAVYRGWNRNMPVLLLSCAQDPVGDFGKGVAAVHAQMKQGGMMDVEYISIPDARHDLLHEETSGAAHTAVDEMVRWLNAHL